MGTTGGCNSVVERARSSSSRRFQDTRSQLQPLRLVIQNATRLRGIAIVDGEQELKPAIRLPGQAQRHVAQCLRAQD
jgi:hypothetical protein